MKFRNIAAITGAVSGISYLAYKKYTGDLFRRTFDRKDKKKEIDPKYLDWLASSNAVQVKVKSFDGLTLDAYNIHNNENDRYIIMVHGINNCKDYLLPYAYEMSKRGYNCLLVDQRAAGESEGEYYSYGLKESLDLLIWINYLVNRYEGVKIALFGISMGAATVMMATANSIEDHVSCIIEDCGYSSMREEFVHILKKEYGDYSIRIILMLLERMMHERFGYRYSDVEPKTCLENNEIPIMFIHGTDDDYVPYDMAKILYNHNKGTKKFYRVEGAGHTEAKLQPDYYDNLDAFISEYF